MARRSNQAGVGARPLRLTILVVDDNERWVKNICRQLVSAAREYPFGKDRNIGNQVILTFQPLFPSKDEGKEAFIRRFSQTISNPPLQADNTRRNLACLVFDLNLPLKLGTEHVNAIELAEIARMLLPHALRFLLTNYDPDSTVADHHGLFDKPVRKTTLTSVDGLANFVGSVYDRLQSQLQAPYWEALRQYSEKDKIVLHALANADQRTRYSSVTLDDFADFYGRSYFRAEASATAAPLDSLLHPVRSLREAEDKFASAFGSERALFVTNGTTTANKIVHLALVRAHDLVFIDKFCHISHHYATALGRANPFYIPARYDAKHGIPGQVRPDVVANLLGTLLRDNPRTARLPSLIAITNCTFDGLIIPPDRLFRAVRNVLGSHGVEDRLSEIAFLFDEAWFGYARFHPAYSKFSVMNAKALLIHEDAWWATALRVYATQSVHKTLSAFRQASVILISDPKLDGAREGHVAWELQQRLDSAFAAHTSTSPHAGMLASLDVGRRHAFFEGQGLVQNMIDLATEFRSFIDELGRQVPLPSGRPSLRALKESDLIDEDERKEGIWLDPAKVTVGSEEWISGKRFRQILWEQHGVQVNKYANCSVLCLFTIGVDQQQLSDLKSRLGAFLRGSKGLLSVSRNRDNAEDSIAHEESPIASFSYVANGKLITDDLAAILSGADIDAFDPGAFLIGLPHMAMVHLPLTQQTINGPLSEKSQSFAAASYVVPYPPGYPVLVPGQAITKEIVSWLMAQDDREVHGLLEIAGQKNVPAYKIEGLGASAT
jgi:arginine decarboxylase